jgi:hypothetical protein
MSDKIEAEAAAATAQLAQMTADFKASAGSRVEQLRSQLEALDHDPHFLNQELTSRSAQSRRSALKSSLAVAEAEAATAINEAFSEERRVELALAGQTDPVGIETTVDGQIPARDFTDAIQADVALGVNQELLKSYHTTGKSHDRLGHVVAKFWLDMYNSDADMQRRYAAGDATMRRRFKEAHYYLAGAHDGVTAAEEAAYRALLSRGDN